MLHLLTLPRAEHPIGLLVEHSPPQMLMNSQMMPMVSRAPAATPTATPAAVAKNCMSRLPPALLRLTTPAVRWCPRGSARRSEEHTSELQSRPHLVCRLLLEKKN